MNRLAVAALVASLSFLLAAAVVLFVAAVHLLAPFARGLLAASFLVLRRQGLALLGIAAVVSCHMWFSKPTRQYSANHKDRFSFISSFSPPAWGRALVGNKINQQHPLALVDPVL